MLWDCLWKSCAKYLRKRNEMAKYELIADIGTDFVNMSLKNADFVLREPALVLADARNESDFLSAGLAAKKAADSENSKLVYPFAEGCVADKKPPIFFSAEGNGKLLPSTAFPQSGRLLSCACRLGQRRKKKVLEEIFNNIGVKSVRFKESVLAAAAACFKEFDKRAGIVVDIGSSVTDLAAVREDKIVAGCSFLYRRSVLYAANFRLRSEKIRAANNLCRGGKAQTQMRGTLSQRRFFRHGGGTQHKQGRSGRNNCHRAGNLRRFGSSYRQAVSGRDKPFAHRSSGNERLFQGKPDFFSAAAALSCRVWKNIFFRQNEYGRACSVGQLSRSGKGRQAPFVNCNFCFSKRL